MASAKTLPRIAYAVVWVNAQNINVRLLVDAPDFPGAAGRAMAFLAKSGTTPAGAALGNHCASV
jgi:hypothetical protein